MTSGAPAWLDELGLDPSPPWLTMGTRSLGPLPLLLGGDDVAEQVSQKARVLREEHDVAVSVPAAGAAAREAAALVAGVDDLEAAARQVAEDLAVLVRHDDGWHLAAAVVCFPSHWSPREKLGQHIAAVHAPVPHYAEELASKVDRFLDRLAPGRPAWRRNWFVHASPALHAPRSPGPEHLARAAIPDDAWLRSERQVLTALPRSGGILFTIRTQQVPLAAVASRPEVAARMAAAIRSWSGALADYRGGPGFLTRVAAWLDQAVETKR